MAGRELMSDQEWAEQVDAARRDGRLLDGGGGDVSQAVFYTRTDEFGNPLADQTPVSVRLRELNEKRKAEAG